MARPGLQEFVAWRASDVMQRLAETEDNATQHGVVRDELESLMLAGLSSSRRTLVRGFMYGVVFGAVVGVAVCLIILMVTP